MQDVKSRELYSFSGGMVKNHPKLLEPKNFTRYGVLGPLGSMSYLLK